jgi:hypothetical protein
MLLGPPDIGQEFMPCSIQIGIIRSNLRTNWAQAPVACHSTQRAYKCRSTISFSDIRENGF